MNSSRILLAGVAALALVACGENGGGDAPASETSRQAAKADAASPLEAAFSLRDAEPVDIDAVLALMPVDSRPTYETARFDERLGATVVENLRFADAEDGEAVTVRRAEFFGVDMEAVERVRGATDAGPDAPYETIFQKVRLYDVAAEGFERDGESARFSIAGVEFDQLQIRQGGAESDGVGDEGARFLNAVNLAGLYFKDMTFGAEPEGAPAVSMTVPDLRFVGFGGGRLGAIIANDFEYDVSQNPASIAAMREAMGPQGALFLSGPLGGFIAPESQRVKVAGIEWRDLDMAGLIEWGLKDERPPATEENLIDLGTMRASGMETYVNGKLAARVDETRMTAGEFTWLIPSNLRFDSKGATYDFTAYVPETEQDTIAVLKEYGLDKITGDGNASWVWNSRNGAADFNYAATMDGFADFDASMSFADLQLEDIAAAMEDGGSGAVLAQGAFKSFSLKLEDDKALDAVFALAALQMGGTAEDLRLSAPAMIRLTGAQAAQLNPRIADYVNALADFVAKGGSLEIAAKPAETTPFAELQLVGATAPQTLPDVINLTVTHQE